MARAVIFLLLLLAASVAAAQESPATTPQPPPNAAAPNDAGAASSGGGIGDIAHPARVGGSVTPPQALHTPDPAYPAGARHAGYSGTVVLWLVVDTDGAPKRIRVARSMGMGLDQAAIDAVQTWRFRPAAKNGTPVPVQINVEVNFRLDGVTPIVPLRSPATAKQDPPQFPGVDLTQYPLVVRMQHIVVTPDGGHYQVHADATVGDATSNIPVVCESNKKDCSVLWIGRYPARWIVPDKQLEILGERENNPRWQKGVYGLEPPPKASTKPL